MARLSPVSTGSAEVFPVLGRLRPGGDACSLADVADGIGLSPTHAQRVFARTVGESPDRYRRRLQMEWAAALLLQDDTPVIDIAFAVGFDSHEAFTRAFRRHFSVSPTGYRKRAPGSLTSNQAQLVAVVGPCVALRGAATNQSPQPTPREGSVVSYTIETTEIAPVPVLFMRTRVGHEEVAEALAQCLPTVYGHVMEAGLAMAGPPYVRYVDRSPAFVTLEGGIPLASTAPAPGGESPILAGELPGGEVLVTVHRGPYDTLGDAHVALDRWMADNGRSPASAPWEIYLTDPAEVPDPADWRTQIMWPLQP